MDLEITTLKKLSQIQKNKYHISSHMWSLVLKKQKGHKPKGGLFGRAEPVTGGRLKGRSDRDKDEYD
jgi:hypothetical protein